MQVRKLRSIIVDDSAVQRLAVSKLISNHPDLELIIQYKDGFEAQKKVNSKDLDRHFTQDDKIDRIFNDILRW